MTMYTMVQSEDWMIAGERRCGCVASVVAAHHAEGIEIHACLECEATWLSGDGRMALQWTEGEPERDEFAIATNAGTQP